jgi:hypothetical protein
MCSDIPACDSSLRHRSPAASMTSALAARAACAPPTTTRCPSAPSVASPLKALLRRRPHWVSPLPPPPLLALWLAEPVVDESRWPGSPHGPAPRACSQPIRLCIHAVRPAPLVLTPCYLYESFHKGMQYSMHGHSAPCLATHLALLSCPLGVSLVWSLQTMNADAPLRTSSHPVPCPVDSVPNPAS